MGVQLEFHISLHVLVYTYSECLILELPRYPGGRSLEKEEISQLTLVMSMRKPRRVVFSDSFPGKAVHAYDISSETLS